MYGDLEGRNKIVFVCKWLDYPYRKSKITDQKTSKTNKWL